MALTNAEKQKRYRTRKQTEAKKLASTINSIYKALWRIESKLNEKEKQNG